jgi:predicted TIM-barrel fold metal-dependent hydrolase
MGRMDEEWEKRGKVEAPLCVKKPSEYVRSGRVYFHAEDYEPLVGATADILTPQVLYYASDWPHWDSEFPKNIDHIRKRKDLAPEAKKWILAETAKRLYRVNGD